MTDFEPRLKKIEEWRHAIEIRFVEIQSDRKHMDERFDRIEKDNEQIRQEVKEGFGQIQGAFWKVMGAFLLSIVAAVTTFIVRGGLVNQ